MEKYKTQYKDYSGYIAVMISTDRTIFNERSAVRARMVEISKTYKELHIIVFSTKKIADVDLSNNCFVYSTNSISKFNYISSGCKIGKKIIKNFDKDTPVLFTCQDPFETGLVGKCLAHTRKNSELMLQIHTDLFSPYFVDLRVGFKNFIFNRIRIFISRFTLSQADVIRVVSKKIADSLVDRGIAIEKIIIKPINIDTDRIRNSVPAFNLYDKYPQFKKIVLMISRVEPEKNIKMAIEALKIVNAQIHDTGLIIVGSGSLLNKLKKYAYKLKLEPRVVFVGWQTDTLPYYKGCDVFLMTSWYEGYGMVLEEARVAGCKIVSTNVGIACNVGANIVEYTPESIANGIIETLK